MNPNTQVGTVDGTGAAINVSLGFVPDYVRLWSEDGDAVIEWTSDMDDGSGLKSGASTMAIITTNGISKYLGAPYQSSQNLGAGKGFTIGADTGVNENGKKIYYLAIRSGPGAA